ncbi:MULTISPECIES: TonB-dependent receptor [Chryseobacterium]|uniref:Iron complex outermembrane receptor protein n=1 Tax=Chryseobacterium camelliae TaxID=1265445 RepID=A0ABU0TJ27_9FLAO|nr:MULTISPECIES: TonB-dependent receptor [Chryseobacterium]MDQ1097058.1 iron complex outermembrane receptor protein [Chryseobacterium camelliae]MDQ1100996.1 iron complex outermembrane receptor protein [Chryseobacterium sp. SORGH_AS_1048]MDR6084438.1 iron complex outermembrane receptor protein [Chryseobacterium sp. SORGH_AS_0909]MDR6132709.1 iron complex outermembrane receptor protein [Chryseobacterium sp. SORGH_AS_1175]
MTKLYLLLTVFSGSVLYAQEKDSATLISEVRIDAYKKPVPFMASTKSAAVISGNLLDQNTPERLLESFNQVPGARMEERSPGSYRISVRGSTLRSPFGVRNIKVYLDDFILSDASGNTYFNMISPELINRMEIYKGPESGDYGAVTGGTVLLQTRKTEHASAGAAIGSYGMFNQNIDVSRRLGKHFIEVFQNYYRTDSYREQSAVQRKQIFLKDHFQYSEKGNVKAMVLLGDLNYETPGGLTLEQMQTDRKQARPATKTAPGAREQNAGIRNRMILAGLSHEYQFTPELSHFIMVQGSYVDFENPFITNFENRFEKNVALRTHFNYEKNWENISLAYRLGFEGGLNDILVKNYDNNRGSEGNPQSFDRIKNRSGFYFVSQKLNIQDKLFTDVSLSLNSNTYEWERLFPRSEQGNVHFKNQWLPNFGLTYLITKRLSVRAKIGKGNSAPTNEEIRSSNQEFNLGLHSEYGWNKEIGIRKEFGNAVFVEGSYFDFRLNDAIVRRQNEAGQEYFVNAGGTVQKGLELLLESRDFNLRNRFLSHFRFRFSGSFYDFTFKEYRQNQNDFSGNDLTGVPKTTVSSLLNFTFFNKLSVDYSHFYTSGIPLNDANSVWSESSFVGNIQFRYTLYFEGTKVSLQLQVQNLYNEDYGSGFDINAFGNRFYNPAAKRNFVFGVNIGF